MRKETYQNKLAALLGLDDFKVDKKTGKTAKENRNLNRPVGISEDEIQEFRAIQGVLYFLQAPELFTAKNCPHCGADFLVSRHQVAFCSYTCIKKSCEEMGLSWKRGEDLEALAQSDVYEGNEPIWIREPEKLRSVLDRLDSMLSKIEPSLLASRNSETTSNSSSVTTSPSEKPTGQGTLLSLVPTTI